MYEIEVCYTDNERATFYVESDDDAVVSGDYLCIRNGCNSTLFHNRVNYTIPMRNIYFAAIHKVEAGEEYVKGIV